MIVSVVGFIIISPSIYSLRISCEVNGFCDSDSIDAHCFELWAVEISCRGAVPGTDEMDVFARNSQIHQIPIVRVMYESALF